MLDVSHHYRLLDPAIALQAPIFDHVVIYLGAIRHQQYLTNGHLLVAKMYKKNYFNLPNFHLRVLFLFFIPKIYDFPLRFALILRVRVCFAFLL